MSRAPGSYAGLTVKQADLPSYLRLREAEGGCPTFEEMKVAMGVASKSGIHRLISSLEERGYITRQSCRARSIVCSTYPKVAVERIRTEDLIAELTSRGFQFFGMNAEARA